MPLLEETSVPKGRPPTLPVVVIGEHDSVMSMTQS
jgi:hypothetical protein